MNFGQNVGDIQPLKRVWAGPKHKLPAQAVVPAPPSFCIPLQAQQYFCFHYSKLERVKQSIFKICGCKNKKEGQRRLRSPGRRLFL